jgi:hypothetical protein
LFIPASRFCQYKIGLAKSFQSMDNVYQEAEPGDFTVPGGRLDQFSGCPELDHEEKISPFFAIRVNPAGTPGGRKRNCRAGPGAS